MKSSRIISSTINSVNKNHLNHLQPNKSVKKPPNEPIKSVQLDLFSQFVTNNQDQISNTVELWERIPKYFFTPKQVEKLRTPTGHADPYEWKYTENGNDYSVSIQPALIKQNDDTYKACFPGVTEELIEEALKKIFSNQQNAIHDPDNMESWVKFTLNMIQRELKKRDRSRDINQIKLAIQVMSACVITFSKKGKEIWKGTILQDLVTVNREEYLSNTDTYHIARLPLFISHGINNLEYRQFNYDRLMNCSEQLARWLYKRIVNRFIQANHVNDYSFMYSAIKQSSGLLQQTRERDNRLKVISALKELEKKDVILSYEDEERKNGRAVIDVKYTIKATPQFIKEQTAANKRASDSKTIAQNSGIHLIRKS